MNFPAFRDKGLCNYGFSALSGVKTTLCFEPSSPTSRLTFHCDMPKRFSVGSGASKMWDTMEIQNNWP